MRRIIIISIAALLLAGCGMLNPVKTKPVQAYTLTGVSKVRLARRPSRMTLLVSTPIADPGYSTDSMIYTLQRNHLKSFAYHRWVSSPSQMLLPVIAQSLRNTRYFKAVVVPPFSGVTDLRLDVQIKKLQQDFTGSFSRVKLSIQATLVDSSSSKILVSRQFSITTPSQNNPVSGVAAANRATAQIMGQLVRFVARYARRLPMPTPSS